MALRAHTVHRDRLGVKREGSGQASDIGEGDIQPFLRIPEGSFPGALFSGHRVLLLHRRDAAAPSPHMQASGRKTVLQWGAPKKAGAFCFTFWESLPGCRLGWVWWRTQGVSSWDCLDAGQHPPPPTTHLSPPLRHPQPVALIRKTNGKELWGCV